MTPHSAFTMSRSIVARMVVLPLTSSSGSGQESSKIIPRITQMFAEKGSTNYMIGEVTQLSHACQAAHIAYIAGAGTLSIAAAGLHDIGNLLGHSVGEIQELNTTHAQLGGDWLKSCGFPQEIYNCAYFHTYAKFLLCQTDSSYLGQLSHASQESYEVQKEQFRDGQAIAHRLSGVDIPNLIALRRCDDMAKLPGVKPFGLETWKIFIQHALRRNKRDLGHPDWHSRAQVLQEIQHKDPEEFVRRVYGDEQGRKGE